MLSKLQIRAKVLAVISQIKSIPVFSETILNKFIADLSDIEDKKALFDIFIKEFIKLNETEYMICSCIIKELVPSDYVSEKTFEMLKASNLADDSKYKLVQLLRVVDGDKANYNDLPEYFDNPEEVLDLETKKLLETAVFNPESMLDFLDFISAVGKNDKNILLRSLSLDYKGDVLANIIYPILYSDFEDDFLLEVIEILSESKSSLAIAPFKYLIEVSDNKKIKDACEIGLKKLKFSGASESKADEYFKKIVENSTPAQFFTTIPDGNGNQAFLISRVNAMAKCLLSAVVINDFSGIVDCFGFYNISQVELLKIIDRFLKSEGKYRVPPEYIKSRINSAVNKTIELKHSFPYEFICWNPMLSDIDLLDFDLKDFAGNNCKIQNISNKEVTWFLTKEFTLRWFITPSENDVLKDIVQDYYNQSELNINYFDEKLISATDSVFDEKTVMAWKNKFYELIYILKSNNKSNDADKFYTIVENDELFNVFKLVTLQRSIYSHFTYLIENSKDNLLTTNIFKKRNSKNIKYDIKKLEKILDLLKKNWINE